MEHHPLGYDIDETTAEDALARFDELCARVAGSTEAIVIQRGDDKAVALVDAAELSILMEEVYLMSSRKGARQFLDALDRADRGEAALTFSPEEFDIWIEEQRRVAIAAGAAEVSR